MFLRILFILLILFPAVARSEIKIKNWHETIQLRSYGKDSRIIIKARIVNLPKHQFHQNFAFSFDPKQKISIKNVKIDNFNANYSFKNNVLDIELSKNKPNNSALDIEVTYAEKYDKIHQYLRNERIYVPSWAVGAQANVEVRYPWSLESATLNPKITHFNRKFTYQGIVPASGVSEIIKLTNVENSWYVKIESSLMAIGDVAQLEAIIPEYFSGTAQQSATTTIKSNPFVNPEKVGKQNIFKFDNLKNQEVNIEIESKVYTGGNGNFLLRRNPQDYLDISAEDKNLVAQMLQDIKQDPNLKGLPLYAKLGRYVNKYIKYDLSYVGKLPDLQQIISGKIGVCTEYARLFNVLARAVGIPSLIITGVAYGEYDDFEGHAWNLIYWDNKWIEVDPTWNLMSGIVSSSHIYFYDAGYKSIQVKWLTRPGQGSVDIVKQDKNFEVIKIR